MRYRLCHTRGRKRARWAFGETFEQATAEAEAWFADTQVPVMVIEAPDDGIRQVVHVVGDQLHHSRKHTH